MPSSHCRHGGGLLPVLLILLAAAAATHGDDDTYAAPACRRQPYVCGMVNITYPFYLSSGDTESYCGYPGLDVRCDGGTRAVLRLGTGTYTVSRIDYDNLTVSLADADANAAGSCPTVSHNVTIPTDIRLFLRDSAVDYLLFFLDCSFGGPKPTGDDAPKPPKPPSFKPITTCGGEKGAAASFAIPRADVPSGDWSRACRAVFEVPVLRDAVPSNARNDPAWRNGGYAAAIRAGFQVGWERSSGRCVQCEQGNGKCVYGRGGAFLGCVCADDGRVDSTGGCSRIVSDWPDRDVSALMAQQHLALVFQRLSPAGLGGAGRTDRAPKILPRFYEPDNVGFSKITDAEKGSKKRIKAIAAGAAAGGVALLLVAGSIAYFLFRKRNLKKGVNSSSKLLKYSGSGGTPTTYSRGGDTEYGSVQDPPTHLFSYEELEEATDSFNDNRELGDGGFGIVYKGYLKDGRVVAVKRLYNNSYRRMEQFMNEAEILSRLRHPNLVMFYGCTSSSSRELLLVYEFVANGTVADHLHGHRAGERALSWPLRLNIAVESAAALTYLHAIEQPIVHRDVKTTNILLDADFHVKVADFGLSRLFPLDATHVSTAPQGTPGYVDPEYHQCYQLTDRSDVYSFGVVLVELISSKPAVDITRHRSEINLAGMAINKIQKCQLEELVDLELGYESDPATKKMMTMVAELAFRCLQQNGEMRPPIKEVLEVLRSIQDECRMDKGGDKDKDHGPFSPNTVHAPWDSRATTPNTSRD
ncbi:hypothetical protein PR202_ga10081 [Eleusine coracana subsp. coracana]|uniref:non-specific serine/threonine protein kinase n=1 Tax=Eleusine coracana subsp. coracana TaxID=191504 RepID=A0AAV5C5S8_ELECO|nr:hypothetical protein PR202_ga10081 [Eleusine coracana subsp. coracana]